LRARVRECLGTCLFEYLNVCMVECLHG
jgi:hypothetical protein